MNLRIACALLALSLLSTALAARASCMPDMATHTADERALVELENESDLPCCVQLQR